MLVLDNPPVNALGGELRRALLDALERALEDTEVGALVLIGAGRMFSAGADIREFGGPPPPGAPDLGELIQRLEDSPKPVVAAIHGTAMGGGLEVALGCHSRLAVPETTFASPEVKLGLVPGAGGTQRLPKLVGVEAALKLISSGETIGTKEAANLGLIDETVTGDLAATALAFAERLARTAREPRKVRDMGAKVRGRASDPAVFDQARKRVRRRARGGPAPVRAVDLIEETLALPFADGLKREREVFEDLRRSAESKALIHAFFAEREAAKVPDLSPDIPARAIAAAAVVGFGTMGTGIAICLADAEIPVRVLEASEDALSTGLAKVRATYEARVTKGRLSKTEMARRLALIRGTDRYEELAAADIVIEAVFEELDLKKEIFRKLDRVAKPEAILATNTSYLNVDEIAATTGRPEKVVGAHFFSPAHVMRLLEVVRGAKTAKATLATVLALARRLGKVAAVVGVSDGHVGNRMLEGYIREASFLLEEGALLQQVDRAVEAFGFAMGPFAMVDLAGLDIGWRDRKRRAATRQKEERYSPIADRLCEMGRFGQKTGAGWYRYQEGSRTPVPDPEVETLIVKTTAELGIERRAVSDEEILERCLYPLINEGARILEAGVALRAGDIDAIWINGYGFPRHRGGPMYYADTVGLKKVYDRISAYREVHGALWEPAPLLRRLAEEGTGFRDL